MAKRSTTDIKEDVEPLKKSKIATEKTPKFEKKILNKKSAKNKKSGNKLTAKPKDWTEYKKKRKEIRIKRRQGKKTGYELIVHAKKIGEKLRCKQLKGGEIERKELIDELHSSLKIDNNYQKFVLAHDTSRVVQWLLKFASPAIREEIAKELIPAVGTMMGSKYAINCVKRLLKYGNNETKSSVINAFYGNAVRLTSHTISSKVFEFGITTCASALQKQHLVQEFYSDLYKNTKDDNVKHIRDVYANNPELKLATLSATKANLLRVINKNLLDSQLVQIVLNQYLSECNDDDRSELISLLIPHIVLISNSKDGARAAMQCIWHGTNKDKKLAMKTIKEHLVELSKHEYGHWTVITMLDAADDTVLLHKIIISELLKNARDLAGNEHGRKVLLWLVVPNDTTCFHPVFVNELNEGRAKSTAKKSVEIRQKEILNYSIKTLLKLIEDDVEFWLKTPSLAYEMLAILKSSQPEDNCEIIKRLINIIIKSDWKIKIDNNEIYGIENAGMHMVMKKLAKLGSGEMSFGEILINSLTENTLELWLTLNRGCFLIVTIFENHPDIQETIKSKLKPFKKLLKQQETAGAKILLEKLRKCSI